jgi:4-methyl-5(b-hydroxyethyl)-thiazole monophosphate biosynthesis
MADVRYTSFPGTEDFLPDAIRESASVVRDGTIITGKGAGVVIEFALTIIEAMLGRDAADDVRQRIQYHEDEEK